MNAGIGKKDRRHRGAGRALLGLTAAAGLLVLQGCGFTPLYADNPGAEGIRRGPNGSMLSNTRIVSLTGGEKAERAIDDELRRARAGVDSDADFDLAIQVQEGAAPLAVQIDASVTRFNYRIILKYVLTRRSDSTTFAGSVTSYTSFNVVTSQYATLFAEDAAREKAARDAVRRLERELKIKLDDERRDKAKEAAEQAENDAAAGAERRQGEAEDGSPQNAAPDSLATETRDRPPGSDGADGRD